MLARFSRSVQLFITSTVSPERLEVALSREDRSWEVYAMMSRFLSLGEFSVLNLPVSGPPLRSIMASLVAIFLFMGFPPDSLAEEAPSEGAPECRALEGFVNINRASVEALMLLPGIGPRIAQGITLRRQRRPFLKIRQLRRVRGIGPKKYRRIRAFLSVSGKSSLRVRACLSSEAR